MPRHFITSQDLSKDDILLLLSLMEDAEKGNLRLDDKVLGLFFVKESSRTTAVLKSSILKSGGGWMGIEGTSGTYMATKEESAYDAFEALAPCCDILAVRADNVAESVLRSSSTPVVNALMGDDHCLGGLWMAALLARVCGRLEKLKIGVMGLTRGSRPIKSTLRILSPFGITIYEDSAIPEASLKEDKSFMSEFELGGSIVQGNIADFVSQIDFLFLAEAVPQPGFDPRVFESFTRGFTPLDEKTISRLPSNAKWLYLYPALTADGRKTFSPGLEHHPSLANSLLLRNSVHCSIALFHMLLA